MTTHTGGGGTLSQKGKEGGAVVSSGVRVRRRGTKRQLKYNSPHVCPSLGGELQ